MKTLTFRFLPVPSDNGFFPKSFSLTDIYIYSLILNACKDPLALVHVRLDKLADLSRVSSRTVRRSIEALEEGGYLQRYRDDINDGRRYAFRILKFPPKRKGAKMNSQPQASENLTKKNNRRLPNVN